jgi:hypothetical protein
MSNWTATNELRWVKREYPIIETVLQQKWQANVYDTKAQDYVHEWRDVPVVEEE